MQPATSSPVGPIARHSIVSTSEERTVMDPNASVCMSLEASHLAGSLFSQQDDSMHMDHCQTNMFLSSPSPLCIPHLAAMSLYYTLAYGRFFVFIFLTAASSLLLSVKL